jgi:hypothetical protein
MDAVVRTRRCDITMLAYLDPGSGSMIAQAVVAGVAGAAVVGKVGWRRITSPLRKKGADTESPTPDQAAIEAEEQTEEV